ncbi:single-stranded DNA-binding protein [Ralstonia solanacearum]|uniref:single-stranded DNA-binding protein n=1 Tax=Ralstonia solanacearum TaxID=305 RepID=UPI0005ACFA30|nr:single-stranded DNA-binding protein [Ralstonia solanacearum]MDC6177366.1 single-stranded DNA-binding protein [Ralstonia solanacearum]MDC6240026.1 single-stranded DNA-binding protein [Ralstonia solanacearum]TYZ53316.1 single-stranded DNA-binding protein [Ralstonia solanacearum]
MGGRLYGTAEERTGKSGKAFVTAKVRAAGADGETLFVNVITFSRTVGDALLALEDGDSVALSGSLTPKVWTDKNGETRPALDMVAHVVLTAYHVKRKREAVAAKAAGTGPDTNGGGVDDMDDIL